MKARFAPLGSVALVVLVACGGGAGDDYMVVAPGSATHPGGGDSPDGGGVVGGDAPAGSGAITGRVCLANDSRELTACAGTGASGLLVSDGVAAQATTTDDGTFRILPNPASTYWTVTNGSGIAAGSGIREAVMPVSFGTQIPALPELLYQAMIDNSGGSVDAPGQGAIMVRVLGSGAPLAGARVTSQTAESDVFYDTADDTTWSDDQAAGTGPAGVAWIGVEPVSNVSVSAVSVGVGSSVTGVPVLDGAITFVAVDIEP